MLSNAVQAKFSLAEFLMLESFLKAQIARHGPLSVGEFMQVALSHSQYGYYMTRDPLGVRGDFTTAPEISQLFGEMIGAWVMDVWSQMGAPSRFTLLECGPGRGTLMADILRVGRVLPGFLDAVQVHLLEVSPVLRAMQQDHLELYHPVWHEALETVPRDAPMIVIGNEFLDALPIVQLQYIDGVWKERVIGLAEDAFAWGVRDAAPHLLSLVPQAKKSAKHGDILELGPARLSFLENLMACGKDQNCTGLFIDYGYHELRCGDTFQALHQHQFIDPITKVGEADLTAHVDFGAIRNVFESRDWQVFGATGQGSFLVQLGIVQRAEKLQAQAEDSQKEDINQGLNRLVNQDQMGALFKVIGFSNVSSLKPAGF